MNHVYLSVVLCLLACCAFPAQAAEEPLFEKRVILERGEKPGAFAIPKLVVTKGGAALIFVQERLGGDWGKPIAPLVLRSTDQGKSWSVPALLIPETFPKRNESLIKPTGVVVDGQTGRIHVFVSRSPLKDSEGKTLSEKGFYTDIQKTRSLGRAWFHVTSDDEGQTWSEPVNITQQLIKKPHWQEWSAVHSGVQLRFGPHKGRLVVPARCYCPDADPSAHDWKYQSNSTVVSDDAGKTWVLGEPTGPYFGECAIVERSDGSVYMNQRTLPGGRPAERWHTVSNDGGLTYEPSRSSGLSDVRCHTGLCARTDAEGRRVFLMTSIPGKKRKGLTLSVSMDEGETWKQSHVIEPGHAAYSDLAVLPDGSILCVYETGERTSRKDLAIAHFNLAWALKGIGE